MSKLTDNIIASGLKWLLTTKLGLLLTASAVGGGAHATGTLEPSTDFGYYKFLELVGNDKKDILGKRIQSVKNAQNQAKEKVQTTYESFKEVTGFDGGNLEAKYEKLKREHERSKGSSDKIRLRIERTQKAATDMLTEWDSEIDLIEDRELRRRSKEKYRSTENQCYDLMEKMTESAGKIDPVLDKFGDVVLALKHELNAKAIDSLDVNMLEIEQDVQDLIFDMEESINEATVVIESLPGEEG